MPARCANPCSNIPQVWDLTWRNMLDRKCQRRVCAAFLQPRELMGHIWKHEGETMQMWWMWYSDLFTHTIWVHFVHLHFQHAKIWKFKNKYVLLLISTEFSSSSKRGLYFCCKVQAFAIFVEAVLKLFSDYFHWEQNETEKNRWRKCWSSEGTSVPVKIQIWGRHSGVFCSQICILPVLPLLPLDCG